MQKIIFHVEAANHLQFEKLLGKDIEKYMLT